MKHGQAFIVAGLLAGLGSAPAFAIDPAKSLSEYTVETWRSRDGLAGWVRAVAQTPEGYLWVGGNAGLFRYGGGRVTALQPGRALARASDVTGLLLARDGTLWITPARGGPVCARAGQLAECLPEGQRLAPASRISDLQQDATGAIWLAASEGIYKFAAGQLTLVHPAAALPFDRAFALHPDRRGNLWLAAASGLFVARSGAVGAVPGPISAVARAAAAGAMVGFYETSAGRIWGAAENGLLSIDVGGDGGDEAGAITLYGTEQGFPAGRPTQVIEDHHGNVWFGSRRGLIRFRPGAGFVTFTRADGLPEDDVTAVFEDREGSLWVGTRGGGIAQFTDRTLAGQMGPPSLRDRWINTVAEDTAGGLWIGTRTGLTRWHQGRERTYTTADGLPSDNVSSVYPDRSGGVWVGTEAGLAHWRDGQLGQPVAFPASVSALYLDPEEVLWIGTADGLARLVRGKIERLPAEPGLELNEIRGMQPDDRGTLWLSAGGKLLCVVAGRVEAPVQNPPIGKVRGFHRDADGSLWLGTGEGLFRNRAGTWHNFAAEHGLVPADLYQVVGDDRGFLWAGTNQGILRISMPSLALVAAGRRQRIELSSFQLTDRRRDVDAVSARQPGAWKAANGQLWFATSRGVVNIDPARLNLNPRPPVVLVEEAFVDGRALAKSGGNASGGNASGGNAFPPGSGALEFHYAAITLIEPQKALYRYRLEGFDPDWVEAGARRVAYYTNIAPGSYRFSVQASNADGVWNQVGDGVDFSLAPHFYRTWWFYTLLGAAALGIGFSFHRMRVVQVKSRYAATFTERNRVARELHDSLLQGMTAALLHLKGLRKRLARTAVPTAPEVTEELQKIETLIGTNMAETRQFVWDLREQPGQGASGDRVSNGNGNGNGNANGGGDGNGIAGDGDAARDLEPALGLLIRRVTAGSSSAVRLQSEGAATPLPPLVTRELLRIVQEALVNALKHAGADRIEVRLAYQDDTVRVSVRDDGRGFDPKRAPGAANGHFGLLGMQERATSIGSLSVHSQPGQGTHVEITINKRELRNV